MHLTDQNHMLYGHLIEQVQGETIINDDVFYPAEETFLHLGIWDICNLNFKDIQM